jgi:hypothetical protein
MASLRNWLAQLAEIRPIIYCRFDGFEREMPAAAAGYCR